MSTHNDSSPERRKRLLSEADIAAITEALRESDHATCKFDGITKQDLLEAVRFYKNFNETLDNSKKTILNSILVLAITGIIGLMGLGLYNKIDKGGQ